MLGRRRDAGRVAEDGEVTDPFHRLLAKFRHPVADLLMGKSVQLDGCLFDGRQDGQKFSPDLTAALGERPWAECEVAL